MNFLKLFLGKNGIKVDPKEDKALQIQQGPGSIIDLRSITVFF